ncbi:MAG: hypothetical protein JXQ75_10290 [Phycisphaerae bacterium]|nr:hypothetical protein [Phycisphaerae bacterium]
MASYEVSRTSGQCSVSGRAFAEGEAFHSVVVETPQGFERQDICEECWEGPPEDAVCHFKTRLLKKEMPRKTFVDDAVLVNFFQRLADSEEPLKQRFRFVLSLILTRKRVLKYERTIREGDHEFWEMRLTRDKGLHRVFNPSLDDAQIEELTRELGAILHGQVTDRLGREDFNGPDSSGPPASSM